MKPINVEITMGHGIGVSASYYKPQESDILEDYLLTISNDRIMLKKQVAELQQNSKDNEYIIRGKMQEKDEEMKTLTDRVNLMESMMQKLITGLSNTTDHQHL